MEYGKGFSIVSEQEVRIKRDLEERTLDYAGNTAKVLIRHLAACQVLNWFDKTYNTLFGSQIALLKHLERTPQGTTYEFAASFLDNAKNAHPSLATWTFEQYLEYPIKTGLIEKIDNQLFIKQIGREFLVLLTNSGYTESKVL